MSEEAKILRAIRNAQFEVETLQVHLQWLIVYLRLKREGWPATTKILLNDEGNRKDKWWWHIYYDEARQGVIMKHCAKDVARAKSRVELEEMMRTASLKRIVP